MSTNFWMCFCGILFNFQGLRRTFPKSVLELKTTVDHQIWGNTPIGWHKTDGPMEALPQTWRTNRSLAPNLMEMAKRRACPALFQLFAEITKLLSLFWPVRLNLRRYRGIQKIWKSYRWTRICKFSRQKCRIYKFLRQKLRFWTTWQNPVFGFNFVCSG